MNNTQSELSLKLYVSGILPTLTLEELREQEAKLKDIELANTAKEYVDKMYSDRTAEIFKNIELGEKEAKLENQTSKISMLQRDDSLALDLISLSPTGDNNGIIGKQVRSQIYYES